MEKNENLDINLELNEIDKVVMSDLQKEMLEEELTQLPPLKKGELSINGIYTFDMGDKVEVSIYIRNGLDQQISIEKVPLILTDDNDKVLAREIVDMRELGYIPSMGGRPFKVYFNKENIFVDKLPMEGWKVKFEKQIKAVNTVKIQYEELPERMSFELHEELKEFLINLPSIKRGQVSVSTFKLEWTKNHEISIKLVIRNGADAVARIQKLPLNIIDDKDKFVAGGVFEVENMMVNPHKARVYNFILKPEKIANKEAELNTCKVLFKK